MLPLTPCKIDAPWCNYANVATRAGALACGGKPGGNSRISRACLPLCQHRASISFLGCSEVTFVSNVALSWN